MLKEFTVSFLVFTECETGPDRKSYKRRKHEINNNYSMSSSWIWSDKITNERVARVGYNHFISNEGEWNNCFSKFSNRVLPPIFISTILQSVRRENLAHYFPYDVKLGLLADSRSFLANQKARNAIVGAENLLSPHSHRTDKGIFANNLLIFNYY